MMHTEFAPAERAPRSEVERQYHMLSGLPFVTALLDAVPNMAVVLNKERQIVLANGAFRAFAGVGDEIEALLGERHGEVLNCSLLDYLGKRPGEAAECIRSGLTEGGCGTTLFCRTCGAVQAIMNSQESHSQNVQECRMVCGDKDTPLDLRVWSRPIDINGEEFTVFSVVDISDEKRRKALERIFFHDVLNTADGVKGLAALLSTNGLTSDEMRNFAGMMSESADQLVEEINAQRMLTAAESGDLSVHAEEQRSHELLHRTCRHFHSASCAEGRTITLAGTAEDFAFESDPVLISRVLINLTKNALEASGSGGVVTLDCSLDGSWVSFSVHNPAVMPPEVQRQLFTRSFSTKGSGRGLGTYSIKLISERYLHGSVSFVSEEGKGTTFTVRYPRSFVSAGSAGSDEELVNAG